MASIKFNILIAVLASCTALAQSTYVYGPVEPSTWGYYPQQPYTPPPPSNPYGPTPPSNSYGPTPPSNSYGPTPPSNSYGPTPTPPSNSYGPTPPSNSYGPTPPSNSYGPTPTPPSNQYGPPKPENPTSNAKIEYVEVPCCDKAQCDKGPMELVATLEKGEYTLHRNKDCLNCVNFSRAENCQTALEPLDCKKYYCPDDPKGTDKCVHFDNYEKITTRNQCQVVIEQCKRNKYYTKIENYRCY